VVDTQNVHDSGVTQSVHDTLMTWQASAPPREDPSIRRAISHLPPSTKKDNALLVLDRMEASDTPLVRSQLTESQVLSLAWNQRQRLQVSDADAVDLLVDRLNDAIEHDHIVCTTGRVTRVIDMWSGVDDTVRLSTRQQQLSAFKDTVDATMATWTPDERRAWDQSDTATEVPLLRASLLASVAHFPDHEAWIDAL